MTAIFLHIGFRGMHYATTRHGARGHHDACAFSQVRICERCCGIASAGLPRVANTVFLYVQVWQDGL